MNKKSHKGKSSKIKGERAVLDIGFEHLFGSKTRFGLLKIFCKDSEQEYFVRELARRTNNQLNAVRREVANLEALGIIKSVATNDSKKKFYILNNNFVLRDEIHALITKSAILAEQVFIKKIQESGEINLCLFTESLFGKTPPPCDILLVGIINKTFLERIIAKLEEDSGKSISYTIFSPEEYEQRKDLTDKFLFNVFELKRFVAIDKLGEFSHETK